MSGRMLHSIHTAAGRIEARRSRRRALRGNVAETSHLRDFADAFRELVEFAGSTDARKELLNHARLRPVSPLTILRREIRVRRRDGLTLPVAVHALYRPDDLGRPGGILTTFIRLDRRDAPPTGGEGARS